MTSSFIKYLPVVPLFPPPPPYVQLVESTTTLWFVWHWRLLLGSANVDEGFIDWNRTRVETGSPRQ